MKVPVKIDDKYVLVDCKTRNERAVDNLVAENSLLKSQLQALLSRNEFIEDCMAEMAMQIYK